MHHFVLGQLVLCLEALAADRAIQREISAVHIFDVKLQPKFTLVPRWTDTALENVAGVLSLHVQRQILLVLAHGSANAA